MQKLRCSYTLLNLWRSGRYEDAVNYYLKKGTITSPSIEQGRNWDEYVNAFVRENGVLPDEFGSDLLVNPRCQVKVETPFNELCTVVGVFDVLTDDTLYEIKTGNAKDSADYATDFQVSLYLLLCELQQIPVEKAMIVHYDQYANTHDRSLIWNSREERERGRNFIESLSSDIYDYFSTQGILALDAPSVNIVQ